MFDDPVWLLMNVKKTPVEAKAIKLEASFNHLQHAVEPFTTSTNTKQEML